MQVYFLGPIAGGVPLPTSSNDGTFGPMVVRIGLFLLFLLIFVFACGWAWRNVPALRRIIPPPVPPQPEETTEARLEVETLTTARTTVPQLVTQPPTLETPYPMGLEAAIADGRPGSVVQAAGEPDSLPQPPIVIVRRLDD